MSIDTLGSTNNNNNNNNNNSGAIEGNWDLINVYMDVASIATGKVSLVDIKFVTSYKTTTINNKGGISFTADKFIVTDMGYSVSTTIHSEQYVGPQKSEMDLPFDYDIPAYSGSGKYKKIGNDSLYFPDGSVFQGLEINGQPVTNSEPTGGKFAIRSDTLFMYASADVFKDSTITQNATTIKMRINQKGSTISAFKKK